jgi:hypothetical protein
LQVNPGGVSSYLGVCAQIEHFLEYRGIVRKEIQAQVEEFLIGEAKLKAAALETVAAEPVVALAETAV